MEEERNPGPSWDLNTGPNLIIKQLGPWAEEQKTSFVYVYKQYCLEALAEF